MSVRWPIKRDPTIDLCPGMLVRYQWAGSQRLALVLDRCPRERWLSGVSEPGLVDHVLVQWCAGAGPVPSMQSIDGQSVTSEARHKAGAMGWVMVRTARGFPMFAQVKA